MNKPIYVETNIHSDMDTLWEATQNPKQHEKWDLRFTSINYLPKEEGKPQYFSYQTNIGFGLKIKGWESPPAIETLMMEQELLPFILVQTISGLS